MTERQILYAVYLLKRLGFNNQDSLNKYLKLLSSHYNKLYRSASGNWYWSESDCIQILRDEYLLKRDNLISDKVLKTNNYITASNLSDFIFCPASFSIKLSFEIKESLNQQQIKIGENYHNLLLTAKKDFHSDKEKTGVKRDLSNKILSTIKSCKLLYSGHKERKPFINHKEKFIGDPDYIFLNNEGKMFIVEEKFSYRRDPERLSYDEIQADYYNEYIVDEDAERKRNDWKNKSVRFHENHVIQTYSYLRNHPDDISHGYLLYWFYDFKDGIPYIHKCEILKIENHEYYEKKYNSYMKSLTTFINQSQIQLNSISCQKCVRCSIAKYCGHKTGKFEKVNIPYDRSCISLTPIAFPQELLKKS